MGKEKADVKDLLSHNLTKLLELDQLPRFYKAGLEYSVVNGTLLSTVECLINILKEN